MAAKNLKGFLAEEIERINEMTREYANIVYAKEGKVATITLHRPKALNALSRALLDEMSEALKDAEKDDNVNVIVMTGTGEKAFCAGADITELKDLSPVEAMNYSRKFHNYTRQMEKMRKPIIARINGFCLGGGAEVAMACDFRIASDKSKFGQPEIKIGLIPGGGGTQRLTRLVGKTVAMEINMLGEQIDAHEAYRIGLVNRVVPEEILNRVVDEFVKKLLRLSTVSLGIAKQVIYDGIEMDIDRALHHEAACFGETLSTEDAKEGMAAFLGKRPPQFQGR
jgi:enoyl-CoA hydratase